jgi:putative ABC transport system ATP-binding protein
MNILGCLDRPTRGTYRLADLDVGGRTNDGRALVRNRLIGFIFQGFNLLPRTTALENCELPLQYRGVAATKRRARAMESLEAVGLGDRVHHTPNQLSGGQQQRVAIARALVTDPPLLLADEPTGNLDTRTSYEVLALLQRLNREVGITIVLVTHEQDIAACASRVIHVRDGKIESDTRHEPRDAAAELIALPPPAEYEAAPESERAADPGDVTRARLGGPVPFTVYMMTFFGFLGGALTGVLYNAIILASKNAIIPALAGIVLETYVGARYGKTKLGRPMTPDQKGRLALWYSVAFTAVAGLVAAFAVMPKLPASALGTDITSGRVAMALGLVLLVVAATALLRYLLFSLFAPSSKSTGAAR